MREIEFRGKRRDNNEWIYGNLLVIEDECFIITISRKDWKKIHLEKIEINPETIGQYTGLKDKNGAKIFEGDIVGCFCNTQLFEVKWCDVRGGYFLDNVVLSSCCEPAPECLGNLTDTMEVIGNIYDNPELLEVEDEE